MICSMVVRGDGQPSTGSPVEGYPCVIQFHDLEDEADVPLLVTIHDNPTEDLYHLKLPQAGNSFASFKFHSLEWVDPNINIHVNEPTPDTGDLNRL